MPYSPSFLFSSVRTCLQAVLLSITFMLAMGPAVPAAAKTGKEVEVINDPAMPVPVVEVGTPAREPFQDETQITVTGFLHEPLYTVPAGWRAVIETVTVVVELPVAQGVGGILSVETTLNSSSADHYLVLQTQGTVLSSETRTANHSVRLYASPETQIFLNGAVQTGSTIFISLSGYLEEIL